MNKIMSLLFVAVLAGCGPSEPAATETVESLADDPVRLKELRQQCKLDRAKMGDALCNRVAEATRKRFYGDGVPYTPPENPPKF
ncbi:EexN family lipoprotein [Pseudomonas aeruginosa]|uniref:EexN family lipoprotein n=1 Tax=Pseudomonas lactis TaxID=1615674 RepID=A0A7Y1M5M4_9PSED|nr:MULTISPECIES: EexN family lipoprotein [Pseudomonas]KRP75586.1 lipoprotein [Pseudomonas lactis]NNA18417.1 EexN family lipoprotein [Pseudomonas lundensis]NNA53118.1 EexN family lipoprotein [Pseudomonas lactis]NNA75670.1 EexN family lipoprotein [Pseudomonas lactis]NNA82586.1 EexN family lipoprotein [Pseudomonas lactis]